jgi:hypothetical protein
MNTLTELNNYSNSPLSYTDIRTARVSFDVVTPSNPIVSYDRRNFSYFAAGINILDIVLPSVEQVYLQIDVSGITGATVSFPYLPSGYSVTTVATGIYRVSNIQSASDWNYIKLAVINLPTGYSQDFSYAAYIVYETNKQKAWTVYTKLTQSANLSSAFTLTATAVPFVRQGIARLTSRSTLILIPDKRRVASASLSSSTSLSCSVIKFKRIALTLTSRSTVTANITNLSYINGLSSVQYVANTYNRIFDGVTIDSTDTTSTFTITLSSNGGEFGYRTTSVQQATGISPFVFSGTKSAIEGLLNQVYFYPAKDRITDIPILFRLEKSGILQGSFTLQAVNTGTITYAEQVYNYGNASGTFSYNTTWVPTYEQKKYYAYYDAAIASCSYGLKAGKVQILTNQAVNSTNVSISMNNTRSIFGSTTVTGTSTYSNGASVTGTITTLVNDPNHNGYSTLGNVTITGDGGGAGAGGNGSDAYLDVTGQYAHGGDGGPGVDFYGYTLGQGGGGGSHIAASFRGDSPPTSAGGAVATGLAHGANGTVDGYIADGYGYGYNYSRNPDTTDTGPIIILRFHN